MLQRKISNINSIINHIRNLLTGSDIIRAHSLHNIPVTKADGITQYILLLTRTIPQSHATLFKRGRKHGDIHIITSHSKLLSIAENKDDNHAYSKTGKEKQYVTHIP